MANRILAFCRCGYHGLLQFGSTTANFKTHQYIPHHCAQCGVVSVNVRKKSLMCPGCGNAELKQYGIPPLTPFAHHPTLQSFDYSIGTRGHFCPNCMNNTMCFLEAAITD